MYSATPHAATQTHREKYHWLTLPTEVASVPTSKLQRTGKVKQSRYRSGVAQRVPGS